MTSQDAFEERERREEVFERSESLRERFCEPESPELTLAEEWREDEERDEEGYAERLRQNRLDDERES